MTGADVPMPYAKSLEQIAFPHEQEVIERRARDLQEAGCAVAEIVMPRLSDSMEEGTIVRWLKARRRRGRRGEELVEIETDKATMAYESDAAGTLRDRRAGGRTLPIGEVIARLETSRSKGRRARSARRMRAPNAPGRAHSTPPATDVGPVQGSRPSSPCTRPLPSPHADGEDGRLSASPVARRIARERGVDLAALAGTGPGGRIVKADVEAAASGAGPADKAPRLSAVADRRGSRGRPRRRPAPATRASRDRQGRGHDHRADRARSSSIARRMAESRATIPRSRCAPRST